MPTKKVAKKKKAVAKKKPAAKKKAAKKPAVTVKKVVSKKPRAKKVAPPKRRRVSVKPSTPKVHGKTVTHHRVIMVSSCTNCAHIPDRVGSLLGMLAFLVAVLSLVVMSQATVPENWTELVGNSHNTHIEYQVAQR